MLYLATAIFILVSIVTAVYAGIMFERARWNTLIKDGIIPTPQNTAR